MKKDKQDKLLFYARLCEALDLCNLANGEAIRTTYRPGSNRR